jgi:hypothetical protein
MYIVIRALKKPERYTCIFQASFANTAGQQLYAGLFGPAAHGRTRKPLIALFSPKDEQE